MQRTLASSVIALIVAAGPSFAELTPTQVWENLSEYYTSMGYEVTVGSQDESGGNLTLTDVGLSANIEQPTGDDQEPVVTTVTGNIPSVTLEQTDDAKVRSVLEGEMVFQSSVQGPDQAPIDFDITLTAPENQTISSGSPKDMLHEFNFPSMVTELNMAGGLRSSDEGNSPITLTITESTGQYRTVKAENTELTYEMTSKAIDVALDMILPEAPDSSEATLAPDSAEDADATAATDAPAGEAKVTGTAVIEGVTLTGSTTIPADAENMAERMDLALNAGLVTQGKMEFGKMSGDMSFEGPGDANGPQSGNVKFDSAESDLTFGMSKEGLTYGGNSGASSVEANIDGLPFPITYAIESGNGEVTFPVSKADGAQPFALKYVLNGLTLGDGIWDMFDPSKQLSRDPANLKIDVSGDATVTNDLFDPAFGQQMAEQSTPDPETGAAPPPELPFEPESLKINEIVLQAVGVDANMTGDLSFTDMTQPPVGQIEGDFKGINALLDKLVAMGIIPEEQIMGPRMMLAMFAKPADGDPDHLTTKIEFKEGGSIFANGQQVK